jgi:hypothetical protein
VRRFLALALLASLACSPKAPPAPPGISGTIRDVNGPVRNATVRLQFFPTTVCRDLGASTKGLTPAEQAEFARCATDIAPFTTDATGTFSFPGLAPGWYSMSVRWTIDEKPAVAAPNTIVDGFVIIYMETRSMPPRYILSALGTAALELKPGQQVTRDFTFRP